MTWLFSQLVLLIHHCTQFGIEPLALLISSDSAWYLSFCLSPPDHGLSICRACPQQPVPIYPLLHSVWLVIWPESFSQASLIS